VPTPQAAEDCNRPCEYRQRVPFAKSPSQVGLLPRHRPGWLLLRSTHPTRLATMLRCHPRGAHKGETRRSRLQPGGASVPPPTALRHATTPRMARGPRRRDAAAPGSGKAKRGRLRAARVSGRRAPERPRAPNSPALARRNGYTPGPAPWSAFGVPSRRGEDHPAARKRRSAPQLNFDCVFTTLPASRTKGSRGSRSGCEFLLKLSGRKLWTTSAYIPAMSSGA
jgi:hypothetical protein